MIEQRRLTVRRHDPIRELPARKWPLDVKAHQDAERWVDRFISLWQMQTAVEKFVFSFAPPDDGELSEAFANLWQDMLLVSSDESLPDMKERQLEFLLTLYSDVGLVSRIFVVEAGLKCLLCLSGSAPPKRHRLMQLFDLLPPTIQGNLQRAYGIVLKRLDPPNDFTILPSIESVFRLYDNLYEELRYPNPDKEEGPIISAWYNLGTALDATVIVASTHELLAGMRYISEVSIESD